MEQKKASLISQWYRAAEIDKTLKISNKVLKKLPALEIKPQNYTRHKMFMSIAQQKPILFKDFPLRATMQPFFMNANGTAFELKKLLKNAPETLTRLGKTKRVRYLPPDKVVDKWQRERGILSANDIYFRDLKLDRVFNCEAISEFNILPLARKDIRDLEVATIILGSSGFFTDSHSDDPDGCNYCVEGKKLWLVWDRKEGQNNGLEDCEYNEVYTQAKFSLPSFLKTRSARWFTVSEGQTIFLPGNLTHKVITLEKYFGLGIFHVSLPNVLSSLSRWRITGTNMITEKDMGKITKLIVQQIKTAALNNETYKETWGFHYLAESLKFWQQKYTLAERKKLCSNALFKKLVDSIIT